MNETHKHLAEIKRRLQKNSEAFEHSSEAHVVSQHFLALLDTLLNQYILIPLEYEDAAKVVEGNVAWLTKHLRLEIQADIAKLEALDTAEENPE